MSEQSSSTNSRKIARRLLALERAPGSSKDSESPTAAELQELCTRVTAHLCDSIGEDGCTALLARALARTESEHPVLANIRRVTNGDVALEGVAAGVESHGVAAVISGLEALFAALTDILGRLIGEDMALRVMLPDPRLQPRDEDGAP